MENKTSLRGSYSIYESVVISIFFYHLLEWTQPIQALPLVDFHPEIFLNYLMPVLSSTALLLFIFHRKFFKSVINLALLSLVTVTIFRYSSSYAFRYFYILILIFTLIFYEKDENEKESGATNVLALLFIFSAFQKMNSVYLEGSEFLSGSTFMFFIDLWLPGSLPQVSSGLLRFLAWFSIVFELIIGAGIYFRPRLFVHFAALFLLLLSFINPPVLYVYFLLLPLFIMINGNIQKFLDSPGYRHLTTSPFFWSFLIYMSISRSRVLDNAISKTFLFSIVIIVCHLFLLFKYDLNNKSKAGILNFRVLIIPALMTMLFAGSFFFIPSPFGFKMFSGKSYHTGYYDLSILNPEACSLAEKTWIFSRLTDSSLSHFEGTRCHLLFPTKSGIHYAARKLCYKYSMTTFELQKSDVNYSTALTCADFLN